ncbi:MAG: hypothetical protein NTZ49_03770 [Candidatus Parcubacteria bacterium]|nr:hypothetical protein [Candidatus Parcubacteria bacterium]
MNAKALKALQILENCARNKQAIYYKDLYDKIGLNCENPKDRNTGSHMLGEINILTLDKDDVMLSSLVTLREANQPAEGFFEYAVELGKLDADANEDERLKCWIKEMQKVFKVYTN